ncbi:hypothetical protein ACEQ8H_005309 [Pleosporales sp. CAS-2024a]
MRDLERDLQDTLGRLHGPARDPRDGLRVLTRRMASDDEEQFDVDLTILDFLVYKAIALVLEWRSEADPFHSDLPSALVTMTGEWRAFLSHRHHGRRLTPAAAVRSRLLQFLLIFTHRLQHEETWTNEASITELRDQNKSRGDYWHHRINHAPALQKAFDSPKEFPLSDGALFENRNALASALNMPRDQRRWVTDMAGTPSLHCLLPLFIELTAARVNLDDDWVPTSAWLELAAEFMMQATIDDYLRNGAYGPETFNTVFAFGYPGPRWAEEGSDVTAMRRLFCHEENPRQEIPAWSNVRQRYINELLPQDSSQTSLQAIQAAQARHSYSAFEARILSFLEHLHHGLVKPDLAQVEEGRINIDGNELSEADSRAMIRRMGL